MSTAAATNQSGIDAISANNGQYTVTSENTNFKWTDKLENPIIVLKMANGTYKYKKFSDPVTVDKAKAAYAAGEFVDAATYKVANGPLQADDKVYIIQESDFTTDPTSISIEESYDLTKFHHRQNLVLGGENFFEGATIDDAASDSVLVALARPGSFVSEIEFKNANNPGTPSIYLPEENNTLLVVDNIREAVEQAGPNDQSYKNFGLFLSHIAVSDDKVNKPNTVMKLPEGVEVIFADSSGQQTTFAEAMNEIMAALQYNTDEWTVLNPQQKLKFKFIVKKDGQIIQEDKNWREITLHVYNTLDAVKNLVKTTLDNTENNFAEGIVDNIDFSGLPEAMKNEAVAMEQKYPNVDGSTPQDGALPQFSNPDNKQYNWINKDEETSNGNHATSPARYFPYDMDLFQGDGDDITEALRGYIPYITNYKPGNSGETAKIEPSDHDKELIDYYSLGPIFTKTMFGHNFTPELGGVNESYWNSLVQDIPIPQLDFEPKVNLDIVTLAPSTPPSESKGNVVVKHYKEGTTDEVKDGRTTAEQVVGENYDVSGDKVTGRFTGKDGKTYEYVSTQGNPTDTIKEGTTEVIYYYKEVP
ncbi:MucBP domain-containing protein, partial [Streptococcus suis]|nr:MucBP domain-containing protein [Streptococcus suis]